MLGETERRIRYWVAGLRAAGAAVYALALVIALFLLAAFGFGEMREGMVLGPRLVGRSIGLDPVLVIFVVLTGAIRLVAPTFCSPSRSRPC